MFSTETQIQSSHDEESKKSNLPKSNRLTKCWFRFNIEYHNDEPLQSILEDLENSMQKSHRAVFSLTPKTIWNDNKNDAHYKSTLLVPMMRALHHGTVFIDYESIVQSENTGVLQAIDDMMDTSYRGYQDTIFIKSSNKDSRRHPASYYTKAQWKNIKFADLVTYLPQFLAGNFQTQ